MKQLLYLLFIMASASACRITADVGVANKNVPDNYHTGTDTTNIASLKWQEFFNDSCLTALVCTALQNNQDMRIALERIRIAKAQYGIARSYLTPTVAGAVNGRVQKFGEYTMDGVGNDDTNNSESLPQDKKLPGPYNEFFTGITFSWELDLWGKLSHQKQSVFANLLATNEMKHGITTWLIAEVATYYYELVGLDRERDVLLENRKLQELAFELIKVQKAGGKVNQLAVDQFEAQLINTKTRLLGVEQEILVTESAINRLLGRFPKPIIRSKINRQKADLPLGAGDPEDILQHRPDIRQAEMELMAADADVHAARAAFYPSLELFGNAGFSSFDLSKWILMPGSSAYQLGAGLTAPIFQRNRIRALYESANAKQKIALLEYEQAVLSGYHEVYTALHAFRNYNRQLKLKEQEVAALRRAFANSSDLFSVGYANYLEVITAQRRLLEVELELTDLKVTQLKNLTLLYRSLGGGWTENDA